VRAALTALICLTATPALPAAAQPTVRVRAESRIELRVERRPAEVQVTGVLRDDRGEPLPDQPVEIRLEPDEGGSRSERGRTDALGRLAATFPVETGRYDIRASYAGDARYQRIDVAQELDLERAHVQLGLSRADGERVDRLDLDRPVHRLQVRARSAEGGAGLEVTLASELGDRLAGGTTGDDGTVVLEVESARLGPPAAGRLVVTSERDDRRSRAQTEVMVVRFRAASLTLDATPTHLELGAPLRIEGRLTDSGGALPRRAVGLFAGDRHLDTVLTDAEGRFARELQLDGLSGTVAVRARFTSDAPWRPSAESPAISVTLAAPSSAPWPWLLLPMAICAAAIFWISRRSAPEPTRASTRTVPPPPPPGIRAGAGEVRGATHRAVGGRVLDADSGAAIPGARITIEAAGEAHEARADASGAFTFSDLADGEHRLQVSAPGYEERDAVIQVPHGGRWLDTRVRLRSLREVAVRHYREVAERLAPGRRWWALWTPRELLDRAQRSARREAATLTEAVERAAYAAPHPSPEDVTEIGQRARSVAQALDASRD